VHLLGGRRGLARLRRLGLDALAVGAALLGQRGTALAALGVALLGRARLAAAGGGLPLGALGLELVSAGRARLRRRLGLRRGLLGGRRIVAT
jgi:hypothetical protein